MVGVRDVGAVVEAWRPCVAQVLAGLVWVGAVGWYQLYTQLLGCIHHPQSFCKSPAKRRPFVWATLRLVGRI